MSNEQLSTKVALLEQGQKTNEQIHLTMMDNIKELKDDNKDIKESVQGIELSIAKLPEVLVKEFDQRYANKETELNVKRVTWLLVSTVLISVISLVVKTQI